MSLIKVSFIKDIACIDSLDTRLYRASLASTPSTSGSALDAGACASTSGAGAVAAYETVSTVKPSTSAADTADDSVTAIDDSVTAIEYSPERSEPDEIDAREFTNNVSAMFDLTCGDGSSGDDDEDDDEEVYHSCEDNSDDGGNANGNTLTSDQIVERMKTMFETSLMLHAKGKYMKACPAISTELYPHQMYALWVS